MNLQALKGCKSRENSVVGWWVIAACVGERRLSAVRSGGLKVSILAWVAAKINDNLFNFGFKDSKSYLNREEKHRGVVGLSTIASFQWPEQEPRDWWNHEERIFNKHERAFQIYIFSLALIFMNLWHLPPAGFPIWETKHLQIPAHN